MQFLVLNRSVVGSPYETGFSYLKPHNQGDTPTCPVCRGFIASIPSLPPYRVELQTHGKGLGDVAFGPGDGLVVSARFRQAWEGANLRGLEFFPVDRIRVRPARFARSGMTYFHIAPQRFGTRIDLSRSWIKYADPTGCLTCGNSGTDGIRGFAIDEGSWTGEDMFYPWGVCGRRIVTDRVRQLRDEHGLTNMHLIPVEEYYWDPYGRPREQTAHLWNDTT